MAEVVLFHHVQGLTDGVRAFAETLRVGGHTVHTPDLFDGERFQSIDDGLAYIQNMEDEVLAKRAEQSVAELPEGVVYAGFSWGAGTAQKFAQTRPGSSGVLLYESCIPLSGDWAFGAWPEGLHAQIHGMDKGPFFALEGDFDAARELVNSVGSELAELFIYPGDQHLFTDNSLSSYDAAATTLVLRRSQEFLDQVDYRKQ